jgi:hypothetical protein
LLQGAGKFMRPCEAETGNGHKRRSAKQAHRCGVLGYKGACRTRVVVGTRGAQEICSFVVPDLV